MSANSFKATGPPNGNPDTDHYVQELTFPTACTIIPVGYVDDDLDYCAVYVAQEAEVELVVAMHLPSLESSIPKLELSDVSMTYEVETFPIKTSWVTGVDGRVRRPVEQNVIKEPTTSRSVVKARDISVNGPLVICRVSLPAELTRNIGVVFVYFLELQWQEALKGPASQLSVDNVIIACGTPGKRQKLSESNKYQLLQTWKVELNHLLRVALMRVVSKPNSALLPIKDEDRFTPFLSYKHLLHACLWANQAPPDEIYSPHGLVYQIVQNVREYHGRWMEALIPQLLDSTKKLHPIPYPTDDIAAPSYDARNDGWNVLDNPDGGRVGAQCNQLATLYLDVLGTLGFPKGEVIELGRVYTVHNGTTKIRHMMKGYNVHGILCVDFNGTDWCYDTTMSVPPKRWYGTLAEAKEKKAFIKFDQDEWRYLEYKGTPVPEVLAADASCCPLTQHLPIDPKGNSPIAGAWLLDKGHIPYSGPGYTRDGSNDPSEKDLEVRLNSLRIQITCGTASSEGYWEKGVLHFIVPQQGDIVIAKAIKPGVGDLRNVTWQINTLAAGTGATCNVPQEATARVEIKATLGSESARVVVWVVWAQIEIRLTGALPAACPPEIDFKFAKTKPEGVELRNLGVQATRRSTVGRMVAIATLSPPDVRDVTSAQWKLRRNIEHEWTERDGLPRDIRLNRNDQPVRNTRTYNNKPTHLGNLFLLDAPSMDLDDAVEECKTQMQFAQWLELEGIAFSAHVYWTFLGKVKFSSDRTPSVKLLAGTVNWDGSDETWPA